MPTILVKVRQGLDFKNLARLQNRVSQIVLGGTLLVIEVLAKEVLLQGIFLLAAIHLAQRFFGLSPKWELRMGTELSYYGVLDKQRSDFRSIQRLSEIHATVYVLVVLHFRKFS
jgi:hypothetical protein